MQNCHKAFKTLKDIEYGEEHDLIYEYCGGSLKRPTGLKYIDSSE